MLGSDGQLGVWLLSAARFAGTGGATVCFQAVSEAFPARVRGSCFGVASSAGRLGMTAAPPVIHLLPTEAARAGVLAGVAILAALCASGLLILGGDKRASALA